jgi:ATP-dependent Clp protease ATP-binding subunit ClpC
VTAVLEGCSDDARRVVVAATDQARRLGHPRVGTEHLLLGLLAAADGAPAAALRAGGATLSAARHTVAELSPQGAALMDDAELEFTERAQRALERAGRFSRRDRQPEVTPGYVLLGVLDVEGLGCQVLRGLGVDLARLRDSAVIGPVVAAPLVAPEPEPTSAHAVLSEPAPRCPSCGADLDGNLVATGLTAAPTGARVTVVSCRACGAALGLLGG